MKVWVRLPYGGEPVEAELVGILQDSQDDDHMSLDNYLLVRLPGHGMYVRAVHGSRVSPTRDGLA